MSLKIGDFDALRLFSHPFSNIHCVLGKRRAYVIVETDNDFSVSFDILDEDPDETYLCACYAQNNDKKYLCIGTMHGFIKLINLTNGEYSRMLKGHGGSVTDLITHTKSSNLIFSTSNDLSIRMWDLETFETKIIFGGVPGHRDLVLSCDVSLCGRYMISSSNDCTIKIWEIPKTFPDKIICSYFPIFSSAEIFRSSIACCKFYGRFVIAKGKTNRIVVFMPKFDVEIYGSKNESNKLFIDELIVDREIFLSMKFSSSANLLAIPASCKVDTLFVFDLNKISEKPEPKALKTGYGRKIKDVQIKDGWFYILYDDGYFKKIKYTF